MRLGNLKPVFPGVAIVILMAGLAGCGTAGQPGSGMDDFLGSPAPRDFGTNQDDPGVAPPERTPTGQPTVATARPAAPPQPQQPQPQQAPRGVEGQPTPGGPQLLAGQGPQTQPAATEPTSPPSQARAEPRPQPQRPPPPPQAEAQPAPTDGQESLSDAARAAGADDDRRVVPGPEPGVTSDLERRIDSLFGSSTPAPVAEPTVAELNVVGNWVLNEEDGLRTCAMTFSPRNAGSRVTASQGCSGIAAQVTSWGLFGSDLLLNDASKTVVARLRPSGDRWFGFTLGTGIPIVLSRTG